MGEITRIDDVLVSCNIVKRLRPVLFNPLFIITEVRGLPTTLLDHLGLISCEALFKRFDLRHACRSARCRPQFEFPYFATASALQS